MGLLNSKLDTTHTFLDNSLSFIDSINKKLDNQESSCKESEEVKKEVFEVDDLDELTKQELVKYLATHDFKKLDINDEKFTSCLKNIELTCEGLLPMEIEIYNKLRENIREYDYKADSKNTKYSYKFRSFVKPKFTKKDYLDSCNQEEIKKETLKLSFEYDVKRPAQDSKWNPISVDEFTSSFKDDKSTLDMFGISKLMLAESSDINKQKLINIYNNTFNNTDIINNYAFGRTSFIYKGAKKGSVDNVGAFRQITSIPISVNHFHRILALRLNKYLMDNNYIDTNMQKGGVSNVPSPMFQQILKLKNTMKHAVKTKKECCVLFVDISNAFPSMNVNRVCEVLRKYHVDENLINYINNFYKHFEHYTDAKDWKTELQKWNNGLLQGCPLSALLFVTTFGYMLKYLENKYQDNLAFQYTTGQKIMMLGYIDDVAIIAKDYQSMMTIFTEFTKLCAELGLKVNMSKTQYMHVNPPPVVVRENVMEVKENKENIILTKVDKYKYLGHTIYNDTRPDPGFFHFYYQLKARLEWLDNSKLDKEERYAMVKQRYVPLIKNKFTTMYDVGITYKKKVVNLIKSYLDKWEVVVESLEIQLIPDIKAFVASSNDSFLKSLEIEDEPYAIEENKDEAVIDIKDVVFTYGNDRTVDTEETDFDSDDD
jgi:hypothetical protein